MPILQIALRADVSDPLIPDFPFAVRREFTMSTGGMYQQVTGGGFVAMPTASLSTIQALIVQADQAVTVRFAGQVDSFQLLSPNGIWMLFDTTITVQPQIDNSSGSTANIKYAAFGT